MRILAIDMGTGTQDILLFDSEKPVENNVKMVLPSATEIAARRIRRAHREGQPVVLTGVVQGGGPCGWALEAFLKDGGTAYATPSAALTFDDDLARVAAMGVVLVSDEEAERQPGVHVILRDLDLDAVRTALSAFEEPSDFDGLALGCLDHGNAPPDLSDRIFRFNHLRATVQRRNDLLAFSSRADALPDYLTRARSMCASAGSDAPPVSFMDTGPAAALGALHDPRVAEAGQQLVLNLGNMHLLAFHLAGRQIASLFEHHTGELSVEQIERFADRLIAGRLENSEIFESKGHGAYHADRTLAESDAPFVAATGPKRHRLASSFLAPYFAAPFGDMMISGCFGLLRGHGEAYPETRELIESQLGPLP